MLMGHPPQIIARGREKAPQSYFEGLMPVQVPMIMEELIACNAQVQEALADTPEVVQEMTQAGPNIVLQCTHVPSGSRRAYSPAPWLTVRWS